MKCPFCQFHDSRVVDSRDADETVRRRRKCLQCGSRFTTYERIESFPIEIVKRDGRREPFDRQKLLGGLRKACDKRAISRDQIEAIVASVESAIQRAGRTEIASAEIGEAVMHGLQELDEVAYIRFASVYRQFQDAERFREEVDRLHRGRTQQVPTNQLALFPDDSTETGGALTASGVDVSIDPGPAPNSRPVAGPGRGRRRAR